ncbi:unnamed protein product [Symbiodinium sp. KB8]|nr:unnamed protein product [Symbiodinium sp. KB8]|mmetsp:Transcript_69527/g.165818  ORF Transcript_69527/g.165818 Transcript_69527/m.165818 type:complete len:271 (-) Transcript_69527:200-1012(-)
MTMAMTGLQNLDVDLLQCILQELEQQERLANEGQLLKRRPKCFSRSDSGFQADAETQLPSGGASAATSPLSSLPPAADRLPAIPLALSECLPPSFPVGPPPGLELPVGEADRVGTVCGVGAAKGMEAEAAIEPTSTSWEWTILNPNAKFKANCGCPLVSNPFSLAGFNDMRAIFTPGTLWQNAQPKDPKKHRKDKVWQKGCRYGSLQLKFSRRPSAEQISIYFNIGSCRLGPLSASAEHCTSQVCELSMDWRSHVDKGSSLAIGVEVRAD